MTRLRFWGLLIVGCLMLEGSSFSQKPTNYKPGDVQFRALTGEQLTEMCKNADENSTDQSTMMCLLYLSGFTDGFNMALLRLGQEKQTGFCPPKGVTPGQMAKVVVKYGNDNPDKLWLSAALFTAAALKNAYPCQE